MREVEPGNGNDSSRRERAQMLHGCRQLVPEGVGLSPATSATLVASYLSGETAGYNPEEGGDDVKSARLLRPGLHTRYNGRDNGQRRGDPERIPANPTSVRIGGCNSPP